MDADTITILNVLVPGFAGVELSVFEFNKLTVPTLKPYAVEFVPLKSGSAHHDVPYCIKTVTIPLSTMFCVIPGALISALQVLPIADQLLIVTTFVPITFAFPLTPLVPAVPWAPVAPQ